MSLATLDSMSAYEAGMSIGLTGPKDGCAVAAPHAAIAGAHAFATPNCVTNTVSPATVMVSDRWPAELAAMLTPTVPLPDPEAPDVIVIQDALDDAVHGHPGVVVIDSVAVAAAELAKINVLGVTVYEQAGITGTFGSVSATPVFEPPRS